MENTIYRLKPGDSWRIAELESWLSYMSAKGWHVKSIGIRLAKFTKGEPKKIKYRVDLSSSKKNIDEGQLSTYKQLGWSYVDSWIYHAGRSSFHVFSSPSELNAPELHTDPVEQSYTLKTLDKALRSSAIFSIFATLLFIGLFTHDLLNNTTPYLNIVNQPNPFNNFYLMVIVFYEVISSIKSTLSIRKLKMDLSHGKPQNHEAPWKLPLFYTRILVYLCSILIIFLLSFNFRGYPTNPLPLNAEAMPIILLSEIEETTDIDRIRAPFNTISESNWYSTDKNFFTKIKYTTEEHVKINNPLDKTNTSVYSPTLFCKIYNLRFSSMADNLSLDEKKSMEELDYIKYEQMDSEDFDLLYVSEGDSSYEIIACDDNSVISLSYSGEASLNKILEVISKKLLLLNEGGV